MSLYLRPHISFQMHCNKSFRHCCSINIFRGPGSQYFIWLQHNLVVRISYSLCSLFQLTYNWLYQNPKQNRLLFENTIFCSRDRIYLEYYLIQWQRNILGWTGIWKFIQHKQTKKPQFIQVEYIRHVWKTTS